MDGLNETGVVHPDGNATGTATAKPSNARETSSSIETDKQSVDPRDYFRSTSFQKDAEHIDPDTSHPWQAAKGDGFLVGDEFGQIALAATFDPEEPATSNKVGLLLAETAQDGRSSSAYVRNELRSGVRGQIIDLVTDVTPRLDGEARHRFVRALINLLPSLANQPDEVVGEYLITLTMMMLPDHPQAAEAIVIPQMAAASAQQQEQLTRLLKLVSRKMPEEAFLQKLHELQENIRWTDEAFGRNYPSMIADVRRWVLDSRNDTVRDYGIVRRKEPLDYPIQGMAIRDFTTKEELEHILRGMPKEPMPDVRFAQRRREQAEIVPLDQVVGATGIDDWTVSVSPGRGVDKIFELCQALREGSASVAGKNQPIRVIEAEGKYFVEADGRHRTAALKALGVRAVPMLVTHIIEPA